MTEFERRCPHVGLVLKELGFGEVGAAMEAGEADLGFAARSIDHGSAWLSYESCYELDVTLVTPRDHPLARRRRVRVRDLKSYPLVNAPASFADPLVESKLTAMGLFKTGPRKVEASSVATIRHYVAMGFGIGLIAVSPAHPLRPALPPAVDGRGAGPAHHLGDPQEGCPSDPRRAGVRPDHEGAPGPAADRRRPGRWGLRWVTDRGPSRHGVCARIRGRVSLGLQPIEKDLVAA